MSKPIDKFIKNVLRELTPVNSNLRSRDDAERLAVQLQGAVASVMLGPYFAKREPTRQEVESLLPKMVAAAYNAIIDEMKKHDSSNWN